MNCADQKTAKIYTFPVRRPENTGASRLERLEVEARRYANSECGSSWYHQEAINDIKAR